MAELENEKLILSALEDNRYKWRTPEGIASQAGVSEDEVLRFITSNTGIVVQSSVPSKNGSPLFTTREHFHEKSSSLDKLIGAFKGRIR